MRELCACFLSVCFLLCLPASAQRADSVSLQSPRLTGAAAMSSGELSRLIARQSFDRRQRQREERFEYSQQKPLLGHDLRVTMGFAPQFKGWGVYEWDELITWNPAYEVLHDKYYNSFFGRHCIAAVSVSYAYRVSRRWELGATVSYTGFRDRLRRGVDDTYVAKHREHYLTVMPVVRVLWLDRRNWRLYTGAEAGLQLAMRRGFFEDKFARKLRASGQFTMIGATIGHKWFFNAELGYGCRGILNLGFGCRIFTNKESR